jgi:hypothetical protein
VGQFEECVRYGTASGSDRMLCSTSQEMLNGNPGVLF